ncbi:MAG: GAF domain-containing protein [Myxococcota bacterium]|nr:GAF domain-containing protein [Myxococcota bacterium]MDW8361399.1 GAF domain-containing protein [Myxococcales bacterium]
MSSDLERLAAELERERARTAALREVGLALGSTLDLDELLGLVVDRVSRLMGADRSTLYLLDETGQWLVSRVAQGDRVQRIELRVGEGIAGWVAQHGLAQRVTDAYLDARFDPEWDRRTGYTTRSVLCVPMRTPDGRIIGVLQCLNKQTGAFDAEDEELLGALAAQAAVSVQNSRLLLAAIERNEELLRTQEQLERRVRELDVLFEIARVAASSADLDELLEGLLDRTMRAVDAEAAAILLRDESTGELRFRAAAGGEPDAVRSVRIPVGQGICGWVAAHGEPQVVNDVDADPRHRRDVADRVGYHPRSVLAVPLSCEGGAGGVLELLNKAGGREPFTDDDLRLATVIAGHVSSAIELGRAREQRRRQDRLSTVGQFLSGVLHDLRSPLTVIRGYVQLLAEEPDPEIRARHAALVLRQVDRIHAMTRQTLAFARGERTLWLRRVYLHRFFEELVEDLRRDLDDRGVRVELELADRGTAVFDPAAMQRAVTNLARNAAEAIGDRGGTFRIRVTRDDAGRLVLEFTDDGPGIPDAIRGRLFESFATHGKRQGTGLGLAVVRAIVEEHRGRIDVESRPGRTTFRIVLPPIEGTEADRSESGMSERSGTSGEADRPSSP